MIRKILKYPNPVLETPSKDVEVFDGKLHTLLDDMRDTMIDKKGVGIASIQVGEPLNVIVIQFEGELIEAINPKIISSNGEQFLVEGCLSIPKVRAVVERTLTVEVNYQDRQGVLLATVATDRLATIWQHEIEHLKGGLYLNNLSKGKLKRLKATYKKANRG